MECGLWPHRFFREGFVTQGWIFAWPGWIDPLLFVAGTGQAFFLPLWSYSTTYAFSRQLDFKP